MRTLVLLTALAMVIVTGCKKPAAKAPAPAPAASGTAAAGSGDGMAVHAPTGVVINPGMGGGGSGGAVQAVRKAAARAVSQNEMNNIRTFIDTASLASGKMPSKQEVAQALQREAPATYKLVNDGDIVLTGTQQREGIWAYTKEAQSTAGYHLIVTASGVQQMYPQQLSQLLGQQGR